jgi:nucleoside-diphosphate-sugar epimerase
MSGEVYNVGLSEANVSKLELCEIIKSHIPAFNYVTDDYASDPDQRNYIVSNGKIEKTGFTPKTSLQMGIAELAKGLRMLKNFRYSNI